MTEDVWNCEDNMAVWNVKHTFGKSICTLHIVKVSTGRAEAGLACKWYKTDLIAAVTAVHGSVLRIPAVEYLFDFGNDDRAKVQCLQHRKHVTEDF